MSDEGVMDEIINPLPCWFGPGHEMMELLDAINKPNQIKLDLEYYSLADLIEVFADKMGGAHIDKNISMRDIKPHSHNLLIGGATVANRIIYDASRYIVTLIEKVERCIDTKQGDSHIRPA